MNLSVISFFSLTAHEKSKKHLKNVKSLVGGSDDEHDVSVDVSPEQPGLLGFRAQPRQSHILYLSEIPALSQLTFSCSREKRCNSHTRASRRPCSKVCFCFSCAILSDQLHVHVIRIQKSIVYFSDHKSSKRSVGDGRMKRRVRRRRKQTMSRKLRQNRCLLTLHYFCIGLLS